MVWILVPYNTHDIVVAGVVTTASGRPLPSAEVLSACWVDRGRLNAARRVTVSATADERGGFEVQFDRCTRLSVAAKAPGRLPFRTHLPIDHRVETTIALRQAPPAAGLRITKSSLMRDAKTPCVSLRIYEDGSQASWGYDILNMQHTANLEQADIWLAPQEKVGFGEDFPITLVTGGAGGIVSVSSSEVANSSAWFEPTMAPAAGYVSRHTLQRGDAALFVRARDGRTYAKLVLDQIRWSAGCGGCKTSSSGCHELGHTFNVLHQRHGSRDLAHYEDVNLNEFESRGDGVPPRLGSFP